MSRQIKKIFQASEQERLDSLKAEVRKLAKRANQRMVRIERWESDNSSYAYNNAQDYLESKGRNRFKENPTKMTESELQSELYRINKFLEAKTSTKSGTLEVIKNKKETTKEYAKNKFGKEMTNTEYDELIDILKFRKQYKKIHRILGSPRTFQSLVNTTKEEKDELVRIFEGMSDNDINFEDRTQKMMVKTKREADFINSLFPGKRILVDYETVSIDEDETEDVMF